MSTAISFLENMGRDCQLRYAAADTLTDAMQTLDVEASIRAAVLRSDRSELERLLGASANVCCVVHAPDDDEPGEGDQDEKEKR